MLHDLYNEQQVVDLMVDVDVPSPLFLDDVVLVVIVVAYTPIRIDHPLPIYCTCTTYKYEIKKNIK